MELYKTEVNTRICTSSVQQSNRNSIEFSLSTQTKRVIKLSQAKLLYQNLILSLVLLIIEPCQLTLLSFLVPRL